MNEVDGIMEVERGRLVWELLPTVEHVGKVWGKRQGRSLKQYKRGYKGMQCYSGRGCSEGRVGLVVFIVQEFYEEFWVTLGQIATQAFSTVSYTEKCPL